MLINKISLYLSLESISPDFVVMKANMAISVENDHGNENHRNT